MSDPLIIIALYRCVSMIIGLVFAFLGYRLFVLGIQAKAGDLNAGFGDKHIALKRAAPGTLFALFGVIIISVNLFKGPSINEKSSLMNIDNSSNNKPNNIDPHMLILINKSIKDVEFSNEEVRMWNEWLEKNSGAFLMKALKPQKLEIISKKSETNKFVPVKFERDIKLSETKVKNKEASITDNKANSADAKSRAAD